MRVLVTGKLIQRTWQDDYGNRRSLVEIQVSHAGPGLQFAAAEVRKSASDGPSAASSVEERQSA